MSKSNGAMEERLNGLETVTREAFARLEALMGQIDQRLRALETSALSDIAVQKSKLEAAWAKIDKHESALTEHEKFISKLKVIYAAIIWLSVTLGALIIGLLWTILTHQVELIQR